MIVDYSGAYPGAAALKAAGVTDIARYFNSGHAKCITKEEAQDAHANGLGIIAICETTASWLLSDPSILIQTVEDCENTANEVGVPFRALYCAADFNVQTAEYGAIANAMFIIAGKIGPSRVGIYGDYGLCSYMHTRNPSMWIWQTEAWSGTNEAPFAHIIQTLKQVYIAGTQADVDLHSPQVNDYGQWPAPQNTGGRMATLDAQDIQTLERLVSTQLSLHDASNRTSLEQFIQQQIAGVATQIESKVIAAIQAEKS